MILFRITYEKNNSEILEKRNKKESINYHISSISLIVLGKYLLIFKLSTLFLQWICSLIIISFKVSLFFGLDSKVTQDGHIPTRLVLFVKVQNNLGLPVTSDWLLILSSCMQNQNRGFII